MLFSTTAALTRQIPLWLNIHGDLNCNHLSSGWNICYIHQRVQALADISRSSYVVTATQPMHRLQIRPIVHKSAQLDSTPYHSPKLHPGPCSKQ